MRINRPATGLLVAGLVLSVAACNVSPTSGEESLAEAAPQSADTGGFLRGTITPGPERTFRACDSQAAMPLRPADAFIRDLLDDALRSDAPIYAEFTGRIGGRVPTVTVARLHFAATETAGCGAPEPEYEFRAHGNEPFWSLEISDDGAVEWRTPEIEPVRMSVSSRERIGEGFLLNGNLGMASLQAAFAATPCRDTMADAWFGYTVQVSWDGQEYAGCGRRGLSD